MANVIQGTDRRYRLTFTDESGPIDLTGTTIYYRWKRNQSDANPAEISKSSTTPAEITILAQAGDTLGQCDVFLIPSDTDTLPTGRHWWDAWVQLTTGERYAKLPQKIKLIDAITDLTSPSPAPSTGPGDGDDVYQMGYAQEVADGASSITTESLGRVPIASSITSLTAEIGEAVDSGSITVDLLLNSVSVLQVILNAGTPTSDIDQQNTGIDNLDETDTLEVKVTVAAYSNVAAVTADLKVNVGLARTASLSIGTLLPEQWFQDNLAASQSDVTLGALVSTHFNYLKMIRAGSIVGISTRLTVAIIDANADSLLVKVVINGVVGTLQLSHSSGVNPTGGETTQALNIDTFVAGDIVGIKISTLGTFTPTTTDLEAILDVV